MEVLDLYFGFLGGPTSQQESTQQLQFLRGSFHPISCVTLHSFLVLVACFNFLRVVRSLPPTGSVFGSGVYN